MKTIFKSAILFVFTLSATVSNASEIFESDKGQCKITFPTEYTSEVTNEDETTTISVSANEGNMLYMLTVSVYEEEIGEDDNDVYELVTMQYFAKALGTKIKMKKVSSFEKGDETGYFSYIKPKMSGYKYEGYYYVISRGNILYQFTALGLKKHYDAYEGSKFFKSFAFLML